MLAFSILSICAGIVLSFVARVPLLVLALGAMVAAIGTAGFVGWDGSHSVFLSAGVAIVALQVGYGLGVIARGAFHKFAASRSAQGTLKDADRTRGRSRAP